MDSKLKRKKFFSVLFIALAIIGILSILYWKLVISSHITTDNAYAAADIAQVTSATNGIVKNINIVDTQIVKAGDVLVVIDDIDTTLALKKAKADLERKRIDLERLKVDYERRRNLVKSGSISDEKLKHAESEYNVARALFNEAEATNAQAEIALERTIIKAPISGIVAKRDVKLGQYISVGTHLLSIVPETDIYINANFKEVQLQKIKIGQPVEAYADIYGPSIKYKGKVIGISGGTGAAFSIIPAQNATGNWIKVVQRLPVRIALDQADLIKHPLKVGLSMYTDVNISGADN